MTHKPSFFRTLHVQSCNCGNFCGTIAYRIEGRMNRFEPLEVSEVITICSNRHKMRVESGLE